MCLNTCNLGIQRDLEIFKHCKNYTTILFIGYLETIRFYCTFSRKVLWWNIIKLNMHELMIIWTQHSLNGILKKYLFLFFKYVIIRPKNCKRLMFFVLINIESIKKSLCNIHIIICLVCWTWFLFTVCIYRVLDQNATDLILRGLRDSGWKSKLKLILQIKKYQRFS